MITLKLTPEQTANLIQVLTDYLETQSDRLSQFRPSDIEGDEGYQAEVELLENAEALFDKIMRSPGVKTGAVQAYLWGQ